MPALEALDHPYVLIPSCNVLGLDAIDGRDEITPNGGASPKESKKEQLL
jgi:hypothetical protein